MSDMLGYFLTALCGVWIGVGLLLSGYLGMLLRKG